MTRSSEALAEFELYVRLARARPGAEGYGAAVRREIEERAGRPVSIGAVYATLGRLEERGLLEHELSEPIPVRGGRSRKLYRLTAAGRSALATSTSRLTRMMEGVPLARGQR
jgi:DNA-binding PadR family transcriptional regulator